MDLPTPEPFPELILALRNAAILSWLEVAMLDEGRLPGTGNTLRELELGYASFLGCHVSEVDMRLAYLDDNLMSFVYQRFERAIRRQSRVNSGSSILLSSECPDSEL